MDNEKKVNPNAYISVLEIFLDRLMVKRMIPIPYENALNEVLFDMDAMFEDEENQSAFRTVIQRFQEVANVRGWYEGEYDDRKK